MVEVEIRCEHGKKEGLMSVAMPACTLVNLNLYRIADPVKTGSSFPCD